MRQELAFPGVAQVALPQKERQELQSGTLSQEYWYLANSMAGAASSPQRFLKLVRQHWSIENSQHQVKGRSWGEDQHTLTRSGLGEVFATLVNLSLAETSIKATSLE